MEELELDLDDVGEGEDLTRLIAAAQARIAASAHGAASSPPQLPVFDERERSAEGGDFQHVAARSSSSSANHIPASYRVEDRLISWRARCDESVKALRTRQLEEAMEPALTPMSPSARRMYESMAESTMLERQREWSERRASTLAATRRQVEEAAVAECKFKPSITARAAASEGMLPPDVRDALHSPRSKAARAADPTELVQRQGEMFEEFVARYATARARREAASAPKASRYSGQPTVPQAPAFRTDARIAQRGAGGPASPPGRYAALSPRSAVRPSTAGGAYLVPGSTVGLPAGTWAAAGGALSQSAASSPAGWSPAVVAVAAAAAYASHSSGHTAGGGLLDLDSHASTRPVPMSAGASARDLYASPNMLGLAAMHLRT